MNGNTAHAMHNAQANQNSEAIDAKGSVPPDLSSAKEALAKLPILGPAMWLYARDPLRRFTFIADVDWILMPPVILDQCRLYTKSDVPFAFFTWAKVNDIVDQRLRAGISRIAPHEWQSGDHLWLIDAVAPFGQLDEMIAELRKAQFPRQKISALIPDPQQNGQLKLHEWKD